MVIMVTQVDGVFINYGKKNQKLIKKINQENFKQIKKSLSGSEFTDVTGGMLHKVEECMKLAKNGVRIFIINGNRKDMLYRCLSGRKIIGTEIC